MCIRRQNVLIKHKYKIYIKSNLDDLQFAIDFRIKNSTLTIYILSYFFYIESFRYIRFIHVLILIFTKQFSYYTIY